MAELVPAFRPLNSQAKFFSSPPAMMLHQSMLPRTTKRKERRYRGKDAGITIGCHKMGETGIHKWISTKKMKYLFNELVAFLREFIKFMFLGFIK